MTCPPCNANCNQGRACPGIIIDSAEITMSECAFHEKLQPDAIQPDGTLNPKYLRNKPSRVFRDDDTGGFFRQVNRPDEWHAASVKDSVFGWAVVAVGVVALAAMAGAVLAQVWRA